GGVMAGGVIKTPRPAAQNRFPFLIRRVCERNARGEVILVSQIILLVITHAQGDGKIRTRQNLILRKQAEFLLPKRQVAVALVNGIQERAVIQIIFQGCEGERPAEVRLVTKSATTDVRNVQAASDKMSTLRPGKNFIQLNVVFRRPPISLAAATGESVLHDKPGNAMPDATRSAIFMPGAQGKLVDQRW